MSTNRNLGYFCLGLGVLGASAMIVGMTAPIPPSPTIYDSGLSGLPNRVVMAAEILKKELNRRFTDRQNIDFGMSRIIREGTRLHMGPVMDKNHHRSPWKEVRNLPNGHQEALIDGAWVKLDELKPLLHPENEAEEKAIAQFAGSNTDVAIYTAGLLQGDQGEPAKPMVESYVNPNPNWRQFEFRSPSGLRVKGPAYLRQDSKMAPRAWEVVDIARKAWASGKDEISVKGKEGWTFVAHRVSAPDMSCARCHGKTSSTDGDAQTELVKKPGDPVGLFIMAIHVNK